MIGLIKPKVHGGGGVVSMDNTGKEGKLSYKVPLTKLDSHFS